MAISWTRITICAGLVTLASTAAYADIYRCVDSNGRTSYSDAPCARDAKSTSNITDSVGACTTVQCEEQRRQQADEARQRLRAEKEQLNDMTTRRRQAEADYERERARLEEQRYRKAVEDRLAALADQAAAGIATCTLALIPTSRKNLRNRACGCASIRRRSDGRALAPIPRAPYI